ncbi:MAG: NAD(P)-dependent oxidoreductase, partial [Pseudomonadota bacterium]
MTSAPGLCLITGASRGIGAATARLAARAGFDVLVNYAGNR